MKQMTPSARFIFVALTTASLFIGAQILGFGFAAQALPVVDQLKDADENTILSIACIVSLSLILRNLWAIGD